MDTKKNKFDSSVTNTAEVDVDMDVEERKQLIAQDERTSSSLSKSPMEIISSTSPTGINIPNNMKKESKSSNSSSSSSGSGSTLSTTAFKVLTLLTLQNTFRNILMRYVMKSKPDFLLSTAVILVELLKLLFSSLYIQFALHQNALVSILTFMKVDWHNTVLLILPAASYSIQMQLEYVAFAHLDASTFSILIQIRMLATAFFFRLILKRRLKMKQYISLVLLTVGVMLCTMNESFSSSSSSSEDASTTSSSHDSNQAMIVMEGQEEDLENNDDELQKDNTMLGIISTLIMANLSAFAAVYTEKVIKASRSSSNSNVSSHKDTEDVVVKGAEEGRKKEGQQHQLDGKKNVYGLAHMQCQLAIVSLVILGVYAVLHDFDVIVEKGFLYNFNGPAFLSCLNTAIGGLIVAGVLKHANSVLKGYATSISVILTGILSNLLFGTTLSILYGMGIIIVIVAVVLYNAEGLEEYCC